MDNRWQQPITQEITVLLKILLIPLAKKTKENTYAFESALKKEIFEDVEYVQSLEKELDELQSDKKEFSNEYDLLLQECLTNNNNNMYATLNSIVDIDEYSEMACKYMEKIKECECLDIELSKQKDNAQLNNDKVLKEQQSTSFRELRENKEDIRKFSDIGALDDMVRVQVPRCMAWLNYDEHVDSLSKMDNKVGVTSPESTIQTLPSFEEYTPPVTYPKEVKKTLGTPIEVEPLNKTKLEEVGLNCNHNTPLNSKEVPSFDKLEPQPPPLPNCTPLDASLGTERGLKPPIKP
ncbi:hypothetical protein Tco_1400003 [Tanacetum coccineum]